VACGLDRPGVTKGAAPDGRPPREAGVAMHRQALRSLAFLAAALLLAACGDDRPRLAPLPPDAVVLAFGDSLTHGTGARANEGYPEVLASLIGREVVNAGVPGEVSAAGLRRLPGMLERVRPHLVILCHGGNDLLRRQDPEALEANLREMIATIRARGAEVVLVGVPSPGLWLSTAPVYERVARDLGVPLEAKVIPDLLGDNRYKSDAIHPNSAGYARLAGAVRDLLEAHGAL
jgi:acyl-CoA thioesterase I